MGKYRVRVATGSYLGSGTWDNVSVSLVGPAGETAALRLNNFGKDFCRGAEEDFEVTSPQDVGRVLLLRVHKTPPDLPRPLGPLAPDAWFCRWFQLTPPRGTPLRFPCYQWLGGSEGLVLREGAAKLIWQDSHPLLCAQRQAEIKDRQQKYRWSEFFPGIPRCLDAENLKELDPNLRYSVTKDISQKFRLLSPNIALKLKGLLDSQRPWRSLDEIKRSFVFPKSPVSEYVFEHWQEDAFFASQFLNGLNPVLIRRCHCLPKNFPVTDAMVAPVLGPGTCLQAELEKGSLYLVDHAILSGLRPSIINGRPQFVAAPLTLLRQCPGGPLLPLAIQLTQTPGPDSPIFLPSDAVEDWLLAKTWVRHSEFLVHEMVSHLLCTHFVMESFFLSTLRQLPMCHPIFKLLIPHFRYTFHINILARTGLFAPGKLIDQSTSLGRVGSLELIAKGLEAVTYRSFCLPHQLADREVQDLTHYYYRDDGLQIWAAIESFVSDIVGIYYPDDSAVSRDSELQAWAMEIFQEGFLSRVQSGVPSTLNSCAALIEYLTMIIFNCSAQHAAVNSGQFEFSAWMPNVPTTMRLPPPTAKGQADLMASLPEVNATCHALVLFWGVSNDMKDTRPLGTYPDEHFTEEAPQRSIAAFQSRLAQVSGAIRERNQGLALPYTYLDPAVVDNSIAV
ncbi:PREDICTED: arachidonate 15-lipoxygenase B isoform X1 [Condylura cristata]|uniref:arachidonate 15-lipoxygenase B isoform X1 n=1 Tax=Condylura cristata TaxID=143302 RepID=UPI00033447DA|nr:PREDICTED: arachidonate 15-lipoxygenase B isoform X1 [Condylura cristata]